MNNKKIKKRILSCAIAVGVTAGGILYLLNFRKSTPSWSENSEETNFTASDESNPANSEILNSDISNSDILDGGDKDSTVEKESTPLICVYICGAVMTPGVYELSQGSRVCEAIQAAGGLKGNADPDQVNQADWLTDGQMIVIPYEGESLSISSKNTNASSDSSLVNINTADLTELMSLSGIGESKAKNIISYRESNGAFSSIEDIKNVSGIGDALFANIQNDICVQ